MSRYDDDSVIALLRDAVPDVPDAPDRVAAIRHRAGHQRAALWTQALGAVASVLLVVGVAAAVSSAGVPSGEVSPTSNPIGAFGEALLKQTSVRFEASMRPAGTIDVTNLDMTQEQATQLLTASATGAATSDGDVRMDGDMGWLELGGLAPAAAGDMHIRLVDGVSYRSVTEYDKAPKGKNWVKENDAAGAPFDIAELAKQLRLLKAIAQDAHYVGGATVRSVPVAEYEMTIPEEIAGQKIVVTFALDADNLLRRVAADFSWRTFMDGGSEVAVEALPPGSTIVRPTPSATKQDPLMVRAELELFGYGDDVDIKAPRASEVMADEVENAATPIENDEMVRCFEGAGSDQSKMMDCVRKYGANMTTDGVVSFGTMVPPSPGPGTYQTLSPVP